ncbi:MAG TPA: hypothetical protein VNQ33_12455 [Acidimicrobiales bacterium]|nr:hypothetical protein [Acidimicrobiales bacterium]
MKAFRRILLVVAALMAVVGVTVSLLPYDTSFRAPAIAGQAGLTAEVSCPAPLVDLLTDDEPRDAWLNYAPDQGVVFESDRRAGGEYCGDTMRTRGILGLVVVMGAVCFAAAAVVSGRLRPAPDDADPIDGPAPAHDRPDGPAGDARAAP